MDVLPIVLAFLLIALAALAVASRDDAATPTPRPPVSVPATTDHPGSPR
jgi:hypothetical protein